MGPKGATDWLLVAVCVAALGIYASRGFEGFMSRDLGLYAYGGQRMARGVLPYVGIFERGGPLSQGLPGLGVVAARLLNMDDIFAIRLLYLVFAVATVGVMYVIGRTAFQSRLAGLVAASVMLSFGGFSLFASNGPRDKTPMVLFLAISLLCGIRRMWLLAGLSLSLSALIWQPAALVGSAGIVVAILSGLQREDWLKAIGRFCLGLALPLGIVVAVYAVAGHLSALADGFLIVNARYREAGAFLSDPIANVGRLTRLPTSSPFASNSYNSSFWLLLLGIACVIGLGIGRVRASWERIERANTSVLAFASVAVVALLWSLFLDFDNFPDAFVLMPSAAIGFAAFSKSEERPGLASLVGSSTIVVAITVAVAFALSFPAVGLAQQRQSVTALLEAIPGDDAQMMSIEAPQPLVLTQRTNPTPFQLFRSGTNDYLGDVWPGGWDAYVGAIAADPPLVLAVGIEGVPRELEDVVRSNYTHVGNAPGWAWYMSRQADAAVIEAVSKAIVPQS